MNGLRLLFRLAQVSNPRKIDAFSVFRGREGGTLRLKGTVPFGEFWQAVVDGAVSKSRVHGCGAQCTCRSRRLESVGTIYSPRGAGALRFASMHPTVCSRVHKIRPVA